MRFNSLCSRIPLCELVGILATALALIGPSGAAAQQDPDFDSLVTSSKQAMLSERALKFYAQEVLQVQQEQAASALRQSVQELRSNNTALRGAAQADAAPLLVKQGLLIEQLAGIVARPADEEALKKVFSTTEDLWQNAETTTKTFHGSAPAILLSLASSQRMLSQRMAALYFVQQTNLKSTDVKRRFAEADAAFKNTTAAFEDHKDDFPGVSANLEIARLQMIFFDNAAQHIAAPTRQQTMTVATASERILSQMEDMTRNVKNRIVAQPQQTKRK